MFKEIKKYLNKISKYSGFYGEGIFIENTKKIRETLLSIGAEYIIKLEAFERIDYIFLVNENSTLTIFSDQPHYDTPSDVIFSEIEFMQKFNSKRKTVIIENNHV